jgi:Ca-activated chloride channel family protein
LILEAQSAKSLAVDELRSGKTKEASSRLQGTAANLRREASLIPVTDERSAESLAIIRAEADEIETLAQTAQNEDIFYSSKRMTESYSRKTRSRNVRNEPIDPSINTDDYLN